MATGKPVPAGTSVWLARSRGSTLLRTWERLLVPR